MDREALKQILPHREPMLLVDESVMDGEVVHSKYHVRGDEFFLQGHFPGYPVVPGVILCEIMAQSSVLLVGAEELKVNTAFYAGLDIPLYMRIANELYLKRLIVGGFKGVYEFAKDFRNEGMDRTHNPEFTCMEIYVAYKDYKWMMKFVETMLERIAVAINGKTKFEVWGNEIEFKAPYRKLPMLEAIKEYAGVDIAGMDEAQLRATCQKLNVPIKPEMGVGKLIDAIFGEYCEKNLVQPTFIIDYPVEMSPLTKRHRENPALTERFELFVNGKELANAYSELNDPIDQLDRFNEQVKLKDAGDDEAMYIDMDFVRALEYGMPPTSGLGMGIDRLTMMMTNSSTIQDVLFFPQMRPEKTAPKEEKSEA